MRRINSRHIENETGAQYCCDHPLPNFGVAGQLQDCPICGKLWECQNDSVGGAWWEEYGTSY